MDRGAWRAKAHRVTKSQTQLSRHALTYITELQQELTQLVNQLYINNKFSKKIF